MDLLTWPDLPAAQQPDWWAGPCRRPRDAARLAADRTGAEHVRLARARARAAVATLRSLPPLVFAGECDELKARLAAGAPG